MLLSARRSLCLLFLLPLVAAIPKPAPAPPVIGIGGDEDSVSSRSASQTTTSPSSAPPVQSETSTSCTYSLCSLYYAHSACSTFIDASPHHYSSTLNFHPTAIIHCSTS